MPMSRSPLHNESDEEIWNRFRDLSPADMKALIDTLDEEIAEIDEAISPLLKLRKEKGEDALSASHKTYLEERSRDLWISHRRRDVLKRMLRHLLYHGRPLKEIKTASEAEDERPSELSPEAQWVLDLLPPSFSFDEFMTTALDHEVQPRAAPALLRAFLSKGLIKRSATGLDFRKVRS